jgi:hypothetical protein
MRNRLTRKHAISRSIGDRDLPLEANRETDVQTDHPAVGAEVEVSPLASGALTSLQGKTGKITGVVSRFGFPVGYRVEIKGVAYHGPLKSFYTDRCFVENPQPPTATSVALQEGLSHWAMQRDYWHDQTAGLESFCFSLASVTPRSASQVFPWGWQFEVPDPMPGESTLVRCGAFQHGNFWTLSTAVTPMRGSLGTNPPLIEDHWARVFTWAYRIAMGMVPYGFPWEHAARSIAARAQASAKVLRPLMAQTLSQVLKVREELTGHLPEVPPISAGFSQVRLKVGSIGMTEYPTDRRPYTVVSISPQAAKSMEYLQQVVLHECIHIAVAALYDEPHNDLFDALAEKTGLLPNHRD